jgi:hypothetical protein
LKMMASIDIITLIKSTDFPNVPDMMDLIKFQSL